MLIVLFSLTIFLTLGYVILILLLYRGLFFLKPGKHNRLYQVTVVVAARNEQENIGKCLNALVNQSYTSEKYEIIIVDDRSTDKTVDIIKSYCKTYPQVKLIQVTELHDSISPKKHALETGIEAAQGEIILTTDADCIPASGWIKGMVSYFETDVGLVAGFSPLEKAGEKTIFSRLMTLDSLSLAAMAAGSFGLSKPLTCNGRNLAYRKETYQSVDGFKEILHLISGDDDLLLHLVSQKTAWKVRYAIDPDTVVRSNVPVNYKHFANQRIRHASKGRYYSNWLKLLLVAVYVFNLCLIVLAPVSLFIFKAGMVWLACLFVKSLSEFVLIYRTAGLFRFKKSLSVFPLAIVLHPLYVVIFGFWGQIGKFQWKNETFCS